MRVNDRCLDSERPNLVASTMGAAVVAMVFGASGGGPIMAADVGVTAELSGW